MATPIPDNAAEFSLDELVKATGGRLVGDGSRRVQGVVTDSRRATESTLFVALRGANFDAHEFAATTPGVLLLEEGGVDEALLADRELVVVPDSLEALGAIAQAHRIRWGGRLVGITGSAGKTSTKEMTVAALEGCGLRVGATRGNLNNRIGVPMTLLTLTDAQDIAVVEMGTSLPGEIEILASMGLPDVGLVTLVGNAHTEMLGGLEGVLREKAAMYGALDEQDTAIINADDRRLARVHVNARRIEFGMSAEANVRLVSWSLDGLKTLATIQIGEQSHPVHTALLGETAARNACAAMAVVVALGEDLGEAAKGIGRIAPVAGRMSPNLRADGLLVLDDTYNANPASMKAALQTAGMMADARGARLTAVLGDMKELGEDVHAAHLQVLRDAQLQGQVIAVGPLMHEAQSDAGLEDVVFVREASDVRLNVGAGDVVLVKGSRSMALERVVEGLAGVDA